MRIQSMTLPNAHRAVIDECIAEAWRNVENSDTHTSADIAADIAQRLVVAYGVTVHPRDPVQGDPQTEATEPQDLSDRMYAALAEVLGRHTIDAALEEINNMPIQPHERPSETTEDTLGELVRHAKDCAYGDSNDAEIEALQGALDEALLQLGRRDLRDYSGDEDYETPDD